MNEFMSRKQIIQATLADLVSNFLFYDRKEDQDLPRGAIDDAIEQEEITIDEMVSQFRDLLTSGVE